MKRALFLVLGVVLLATAALSAGAITKQPGQWDFPAGLWVGTSVAPQHKVARILGGTVDWAFPLDGGCQDTASITVTGAVKGDPCFIGYGPNDGGIAIQTAAGGPHPFCVVNGAGTAILRVCNEPVGAIIDAGFQLRVISSQ